MFRGNLEINCTLGHFSSAPGSFYEAPENFYGTPENFYGTLGNVCDCSPDVNLPVSRYICPG
jgi:hypothetical protein